MLTSAVALVFLLPFALYAIVALMAAIGTGTDAALGAGGPSHSWL